ncbi:nucleotidyltransferase family protein [Flavobacteriaceae bacterium TP-CH-4]|uniref:Nucleotidyltransferase family protein n=1 Tax=Pelagihabitans pacificus TaxID=2696054 RepID=A0A967AVF0_9FLAO|nr:nucleotidyltransferase family protein [Pelagihabitans pacificus]NHF59890.1 nucleotidyltransferase family protein [Pelagihabitans pacificus]
MTGTKSNIALVILAAGASTRMGRPKQLLPWGQDNLLRHAIKQAHGTGLKQILVVLGANAQVIKKNLGPHFVDTVTNPDWEEGLGSSLSYGIQQLLASQQSFKGVLIMLADQPLVDKDYLNELITAFETREKGIVVTSYGQRVGVPAVFHSRYFERLKALNKDFGAKEIIQRHKNDMFVVDPKGKAVDVDTRDVYERLWKEAGDDNKQ